jgi:hypothetical protein
MLNDFKTKYEHSQRDFERLKLRLSENENVCISQQNLITIQSEQVQKLKSKLKKYKRRLRKRDATIIELVDQ